MDWNLKKASWDITELEQETIPNIGPFGGSSSYGDQGINGDFSVDLKLGQVVESGVHTKVQSVSKMALSPSNSWKRTRAINNGIHKALCLVDGCNTDLSNCREYHRRHKVCELHSKASQVIINGHKRRFCQQCSRFHSLDEFDEGKRSCRKRLDGHNRRRRKRQPEPLSHVGRLFSSNQGTTLLPFSSPQVYPTTGVANWDGFVKAEEGSKLYNQFSHSHLPDKHNPYPESSSHSNRGGKHFSFLHSTNLELSNQAPQGAYACQPLLKAVASSESGGSNNKMFCDGFSTRVIHSNCALSLLSSSPTKSSGIGLSHVMQPNSISAVHFNSMEPMESILVPNAGDADVHCQGMFRMAPCASRDKETPQTLPFYWE